MSNVHSINPSQYIWKPSHTVAYLINKWNPCYDTNLFFKILIWLYWVLVVACRLRCSVACEILVLQAGIEPTSPASQELDMTQRVNNSNPCIARWVLNHWTTRAVPDINLFCWVWWHHRKKYLRLSVQQKKFPMAAIAILSERGYIWFTFSTFHAMVCSGFSMTYNYLIEDS